MIELNKLVQELHEAAVAKCFWDVEDALEKHIAKMHSELSEVLQEDRCGHPMLYVDDIMVSEPVTDIHHFDGRKPEGVAAELADFVMMVLDFACQIMVNVDKEIGAKGGFIRRVMEDEYKKMTIYNLVLANHNALAKVTLADDSDDVFAGMWCMIYGTELWLEQRGIDLWQVIRLKMEYNRARPPLHGRKY